MLSALRLNQLKDEPNDIIIMDFTSPSKLKKPNLSLMHRLCSSLQNKNNRGGSGSINNGKQRLFVIAAILAALVIFVNTMSPNDGGSIYNDNINKGSWLRTFSSFSSSSEENQQSNQFSFSSINSPYEQIWINSKLPGWAKKKDKFRKIESSITPNERLCYVHVGKAGGSSVGCSLGFNLHCANNTQMPLNGLLPQRATRMFHADLYDCYDNSAYFLFVVRNPIERLKSAFLYDRPKSAGWLKHAFPKYYERRKSFYLDCPSYFKMENLVQDGLKKDGTATEECKLRAKYAVSGEQHYSCHMYFNYQFHLDGLPSPDSKILVIRNEHLTQDWNAAEHYIGGEKDIIDVSKANETIGVMNKSTKDAEHKWLSEESTKIICRQLCHEIVAYKRILRRALNLNYPEIEKTIDELRGTCGKYADYEEEDCSTPMPDLTEKLINSEYLRCVMCNVQCSCVKYVFGHLNFVISVYSFPLYLFFNILQLEDM